MSNVNTVTLSGRAYSKRTNQVGDNMVINFVVRQFFKNKAGEDAADFIPVEAWNKLAEHIDKRFEEGMVVCIRGVVKAKKDKNNHTYLVIKVEDFDGFSLGTGAKSPAEHSTDNGLEDFMEGPEGSLSD